MSLFSYILKILLMILLVACFSNPQSPGSENKANSLNISNYTTIGTTQEHTHKKVTITSDDVSANRLGVYFLTGGNTDDGHQHRFSTTPANLIDLRAGNSITILTETINNHSHQITLRVI